MQQAHDEQRVAPEHVDPPPPEDRSTRDPAGPGQARPRVWPVFAAFALAFVLVLVLNALLMGVLVAILLAKGGKTLDPVAVERALFQEHGPGLLAASGAISVVCLAGAAIAGAWLSPRRLAPRLGLQPARASALLVGALTPLPFGWAAGLALELLGLGDKSSSLKLISDTLRASSTGSFVVLTVVVALLGPFAEELMFRGYMQTRLLERLPAWAAVGVSSLLFALMHLDPVHVLGVFPIGVALGVVAWRSRSLWPAVLAHALNNGIAAIAGRLTGAEPGERGSWVTLVVLGGLAAGLMAVYLWITRPAAAAAASPAAALRGPPA